LEFFFRILKIFNYLPINIWGTLKIKNFRKVDFGLSDEKPICCDQRTSNIQKQPMRKTDHPQSLKQVFKPDRTGAGPVRLFSSKILPYKGWRRTFIPFLLIALILSIAPTAQAAWYDSNWQYRMAITIDGSRVAGGPHVDFPVLISFTDTDLSAARADGWDLLFTDSDETTKLDHEIESFNDGSGVLVAWVRIPAPGITNGTNKTIYLYYGYPTVPADQQNVNGVWNANYQAVWHLKEDPSGTAPQMNDSKSTNHGTSYGTMTTADQVPGKINGSLDFDASDDEIRMSNAIIGDDASFTITAWIQSGDYNVHRTIYSEGNTSAGGYLNLYLADDSDGPIVKFYSVNPGGDDAEVFGTTNVEDNLPHFVALVQRSKTNRELFIDSVSESAGVPNTENAGTLTHDVAAIGFLRTNWGADSFTGILDEVRIANIDRSNDWITTEYYNQSNPGTGAGGFLSSLGSEESATPAVTSAVAEITPNDVTTGSSTNLFSYDILATIGGSATGVNRVTVTVPASFGDPAVIDVRVGGTSVAFTDNTSGKDISVDLTAKVISTDTIQVLFTADAPGAADAGGQDFLSTVDDAGTPEVSQATTEGNADGDGTDADSWTVTTTDAGCNVLMIVGSGASPNASDLAIATFLTNNGLTVFFADDGDSEAQFEAAIATNDIDVIYVSESCGSSTIGYKTDLLAVGQVMGNSGNWENIDVANEDQSAAGTDIRIVNNTHYITSGYSTGLQTVYNASASRGYGNNGIGAGALVLAENPADAGQQALVVYEPGDLLYDDIPAPARRAGIFTDDEFSFWNTDAQRLLLRTVVWAANAAGTCGPSWTGATSAVAEITPNDVTTGSSANAFTYDILATIGGGDTGIDRVTVTVPATFGDPTVTDVKVGGVSVAYTNNTAGKLISIDLTSKVTSTDTIQILFTADAPGSADPAGKNFTSTVDDSGTAEVAQASTEGNADGDGTDNNSWTVTATNAGAGSLLARYWIDEAASGQSPTDLADAAAAPLDMPLVYAGSSPVWSDGSGGNRHLRYDGTDGTDTGGAVVDINGTKIDAIHGSTTASLEVKYAMDSDVCTTNDERIFGISDGDDSANGWMALRVRQQRDTLQVRWAGVGTVGVYALGSGTPSCPIDSASTVHWVIDTTQAVAANRVKAYVDGTPATVTAIDGSALPPLNATIDLGAGTRRMFLGRSHTPFRTFRGRIWYAALYQGVLNATEVATQAAAINACDDINVPCSSSIAGTVFEDVNGDTNPADASNRSNVDVYFYLDGGDGQPDGVDDTIVTGSPVTTDGSGNYTSPGLVPATATYWVVVDSKTVTPSAGFNGGSAQGDVWAEQTYGTIGAWCDDGSGGINVLGAAGACYGGQASATSDNASALATAEHVTRVAVAPSNVNGVNFGFSFVPVANTRDGDDDGAYNRTIQGSLRQFIQNGNAVNGTQSSVFRIPNSDPGYTAAPLSYTIQPNATELPIIVDPIVLDGTTQTGFSGSPIIEIDGSLLPVINPISGLIIEAGNSTVRGFVINRFAGTGLAGGVYLRVTGNNLIEGNYIGTNITGTAAAGNLDGILIDNSSNTTIGGTTVAARNVIAGNNDDNIDVKNSSNVTIQGNYIGTNATGTAALGGEEGVLLDYTSNSTIGGTSADARNIISGNEWGVRLDHNTTTGNVVQGNYHNG
jgi:hypothetical protein